MTANFIAETDGRGCVVWVWRKADGERIARPVRDITKVRHELTSAGFSGAAPEAISDWFANQARGSN